MRRAPAHRLQAAKARGPKGVAMVMVLVAVLILTLVLVEFSKTSRTHLNQGVNVRDTVRANVIAETGLVLTRACLDPNIFGPMGALLQGKNLDMQKMCDLLLNVFLAGRLDLPVGGLSVELDGIDNLGLGKGGLEEMSLVPEESFIGLAGLYCPPQQTGAPDFNCAPRLQTVTKLRSILCDPDIAHVFESDQEDGKRYTRWDIITNLVDWVDKDDNRLQFDTISGQFIQGAGEGEDSYYGAADDRYRSKDAPFDSIEELRMIRGINDDLYNFLKDRVSVHAQAKVYVQTATVDVFEALLRANSPMFQMIENNSCGEDTSGTGSTADQFTQALRLYADLIVKARSQLEFQRIMSGAFLNPPFRNAQEFLQTAQDPAAILLNSPMVQYSPVLQQQYTALASDPTYQLLKSGQLINWESLGQGITVQIAQRMFRLNIKARVGNISRRIQAVLKQDGQVVRTLYYRED